MFVNGVAVATGGGGYDGADNSPLVVGSNTGDLTNTFPGADSFFKGDLDSLELFVLGKSQTNSVEYGNFSLATDNWFVADALSGVNPGDINGDGSVNGNGSGSVATDDVSAFIANWRHENRVNGLIVGDLNSRGFGDLNMDGITDELDWGILRANHPGASNLNLGALLNGVATPEPTSAVLGLLGLIGLSVIRRRS